MQSFVILMVSLMLFVILLPLTTAVAILKIIRGVINITESTLTFFIKATREEITKQ